MHNRSESSRLGPFPALRLVALLALLAWTATACGGGQPTPAEDRATAQEANLKPADFPSGWKSKPHEKLPGEDELAAELATCLGIEPPATRATAEVRSLDFSSGFATQASSVVTFVKTDEVAAADAAAFAGDKFAACIEPGLAKQVKEVLPPEATVDQVSVVERPFPALGDRTVAHRFTAHINPMDIVVNIDLVHVFEGRAEVALTFVNPGQPFPEDVARSVAAKVVARL